MFDDDQGLGKMTEGASQMFMATYDRHMIEFLEKNGIKVDPRNLAATMRDLEKKGYKVLTERVSSPMESTTWTFYLTKVIDKTQLKMTFSLKIGDEKK